MSQNTGIVKGAAAPTSADACMSIVHSLMCYRQGAGDRGESEQFSRRAIESLVKKLKEKRDELDSLITAITTNGSHQTKCVTIPRTLDGRLQVAGRKCFPHVIYSRIWRWPDLHKNELRRADGCSYAFDLKVDSVCVNPYHYIRDVSLGVDLSALSLVKNEQMSDGQWMGHEPDTYRYNGYGPMENYPGLETYRGPPTMNGHLDRFDCSAMHIGPRHQHPQQGNRLLMESIAPPTMMPPPAAMTSSMASPMSNQPPLPTLHDNKAGIKFSNHQVANFLNDNIPPQQQLQPQPQHQLPPQQQTQPSTSGHSNWQPVKTGTLEYTTSTLAPGLQEIKEGGSTCGSIADPRSPMPQSPMTPLQMKQYPMNNWREVQQQNNFEPVSKLPLPQFWCSITYYELDVQVGEIFKVPTRCKYVSVDGYVEQHDKHRFCVGALSNVHRTDISEKARLHIGPGIQLQLIGEGDIFLRCVSEHSIFVQSHYLDWAAGKAPGEVVHKMHKGAEFKVFDLKQFYHEMKRQANINGVSGVHGGHLAPAISHAAEANVIRIDDLRRLCILRLSFVKGWGADYKRKTIKETPCWIEIQLHRALQVLDEVLLHALPTETTKKRQQPIMLSCS